MTLEQFQFLSPASQLAWAVKYGTYVAHRWKEDRAISLFHLSLGHHGFLVEVGANEAQDCLVLLRSFCLSESLEEYAASVRLPVL